MFRLPEWLYIGTVNNRRFYSCPKCRHSFEVFSATKYCQHCGKKLKNPLTNKD